MRILHIDKNHPLMLSELEAMGFKNDLAYTLSKEEILNKIHSYTGIIIRSRITINKEILDAATNLKFIGRVGAGLENIDVEEAQRKGILLFSAPEGNRDAVGEHAIGMLLSLLHKLKAADHQVRAGLWSRESNRGLELGFRKVGIIGYGNMGKAFAKKLKGFGCEVYCYDILPNIGDEFATQVSLKELQNTVDVVSLHTPWTPLTHKMVNSDFIEGFRHPFWFINTARGRSVVTADLVRALENKKILGAGLDVLEFEKSSFESLFKNPLEVADEMQYLMQADNVLLSPHIAGWTVESKEKLAKNILEKISQHLSIFKNTLHDKQE